VVQVLVVVDLHEGWPLEELAVVVVAALRRRGAQLPLPKLLGVDRGSVGCS
jgi:hypothetical protein